MLKITHTAIITDNDFDADDMLECDICRTTDTPLYCTEYSDHSQTIRCAAHRTDTAQITLDALTALILSNELDAIELLDDITNAEITELPQIAFALHESLQIAPDHAQRLIDALRTDDALRYELCESLEICPIHLCDLQICIDDQNPTCALHDTHHP